MLKCIVIDDKSPRLIEIENLLRLKWTAEKKLKHETHIFRQILGKVDNPIDKILIKVLHTKY